jgi:hypothetical protein
VIRLAVKNISIQGRATRGVRIMDLEEGDSVAALARIPYQELQPGGRITTLKVDSIGCHTTPKAKFIANIMFGPLGLFYRKNFAVLCCIFQIILYNRDLLSPGNQGWR